MSFFVAAFLNLCVLGRLVGRIILRKLLVHDRKDRLRLPLVHEEVPPGGLLVHALLVQRAALLHQLLRQAS